jgi:hypothetical protein
MPSPLEEERQYWDPLVLYLLVRDEGERGQVRSKNVGFNSPLLAVPYWQ